MVPDLELETKLPRGAVDLGDGYILLHARDDTPQEISVNESAVILTYAQENHLLGDNIPMGPVHSMSLVRWARLRLPNGQIARSAWKEKLKTLKQIRISRNIKVGVYLICLDSY
jgi:hypothetical protein